jgi:hypothetical protein
MSKTRDTGYLNNIIKYTESGDITFVNGNTTLLSISSSGAITTTGVISGSSAESAISASYAQVATSASQAQNTVSSSFAANAANATSASFALNAANAVSASQAQNAISSSFATNASSSNLLDGKDSTEFAITGSNIFTGTQYTTDTLNPNGFGASASVYTDGGLRVTKDAYVSGTIYVNNLTVFGTQSINYVTSSQLNISTNIISVNTDTPSIRFGGLSVYDSGSTGLTGSMLWDSERDHWVYSNPSGSSYSGGMLMSGPRASSLGNEQGTLNNFVMKGQGGDHITSSQIIDDGTTVRIPGNLQVTGSMIVTSALTGSNATFSGNVGIGTISPTNTLNVRGDNGTSTAAILRLRDTNTTSRTTRLQFEDYTGALADGLIDFRIGTAGNASTATLSIGINSAGLTFNSSNAATFASSVSTNNLLTIAYADISTGDNRGLRIVNTDAGEGTAYNITSGRTGNNNGDFVIRNTTTGVNNLVFNRSTGAATFSSSVTAVNAILTSGGTERYLQLSGYNSSYATIRSNVGFNSSYNNLSILLNVNATENGQGNNTIPSWAINLGGNEGDADSFCILRSPAGSYTFSNLLKISGTGAAAFASSITANSLSIGSTSNSTNPSNGSIVSAGGLGLGGDIHMHPFNANQSNYGYIKTAATTVNTTTLTIGTTYGFGTGVDAISIFNGSTTFTNNITAGGNINANNIKTFSLTLQGLSTPVSTGLPINALTGGRTYLLLTSQQWDAGNSTSSTITMIRCGYDGNNFTAVVLGSSNATAETWSQSGGILFVTGNTNFAMDITVISNG